LLTQFIYRGCRDIFIDEDLHTALSSVSSGVICSSASVAA
jgi:hypothetical protein